MKEACTHLFCQQEHPWPEQGMSLYFLSLTYEACPRWFKIELCMECAGREMNLSSYSLPFLPDWLVLPRKWLLGTGPCH